MNDTRRIQPRTLKGFRDLGPELMMRKEAMLDRIRTAFRSFGFMPIDTPALEYAEVLLANGVKAAAAVVPAARAVGVPVVWAKHDFSWDRELAPRLGRMSDAVLATSASVKGGRVS